MLFVKNVSIENHTWEKLVGTEFLYNNGPLLKSNY